MAGERVVKYFKGPAFTDAEWTTRNPYLAKGEIGYLLSGGLVVGAKVGPGLWLDLDFLGEDVYNYSEAVTNPIGDATGVLQGERLAAIIHKMLNPYQPPVVSNVLTNASGGYVNDTLREIGQSVAGPITLLYSISNPSNLNGATPINVTAGGTFSNEGNFANTGNVSLSLVSPLNPASVLVKTIEVRATHTNGVTSPVNAYIRFYPRIMWVSSNVSSIADGTAFMALANKQHIISNQHKRDYNFVGAGYSWLAIPAMLAPSGLIFTDITDPNAPAGYGMTEMGTISINNGVATYNYVLYRSNYLLFGPSKLRIS